MSITYRFYLDGAPASGFQCMARNVFTFAEYPVTVSAVQIQPDDEYLTGVQNPNTTPDVAALHGGIHGVPIGEMVSLAVTLPPGPPTQDLAGNEIHVFFFRLRLMVGITDGVTTVPKSRCSVMVRDFIEAPGRDITNVLFPNPSYPAAPGSHPYFSQPFQWTDPTGVATMIGYLGTAMKRYGESVYTLGHDFGDASFEIRGAGTWFWLTPWRRIEEMGIVYDPAAFDPGAGTWPIPAQTDPFVANPRPNFYPQGYSYPTTHKGYWQSVDVQIRDTAGAPIVGATVTLSDPSGAGPTYTGTTVSTILSGTIAPTGRVIIPMLPLGSTLWDELGGTHPGTTWYDFPLESASGYPASQPAGSALTPPRVVRPDQDITNYPLFYNSIVTNTLTGTSGPSTGGAVTFGYPGFSGGEWASRAYSLKIQLGTTVLIDHEPIYIYEELPTLYVRDGFEPVETPPSGPVSFDIDRLGNGWVAREQDTQVVVCRRLAAWQSGSLPTWQTFPVGAIGRSPWIHVDETHPEMRVNVVFHWGTDTLYLASSSQNGTGGWSLLNIGTGLHPFIRKDKSSGITFYLYWRGDTVYLKRSPDDGQTFLESEITVLTSAVEATYTLDFRLDPSHTIEMPYSDGTDILSRISTDNGKTWADA